MRSAIINILELRNAKAKTDTSRCRGFTLIELLIVIAIIGIMAGVAIPLFKSSVRKANEAAAVSTLGAIRIAQAKYVIDHKGQYGTFKELFEEGYYVDPESGICFSTSGPATAADDTL